MGDTSSAEYFKELRQKNPNASHWFDSCFSGQVLSEIKGVCIGTACQKDEHSVFVGAWSVSTQYSVKKNSEETISKDEKECGSKFPKKVWSGPFETKNRYFMNCNLKEGLLSKFLLNDFYEDVTQAKNAFIEEQAENKHFKQSDLKEKCHIVENPIYQKRISPKSSDLFNLFRNQTPSYFSPLRN